MSEKIKKYLKNSIDEKGNYCYSLPVETTKAVIKELDRLNNIINEIQWKPIKQYEKPKYDWVLIKYFIEPNFECIPCVAENRFGKWYDGNDNLINGEVRYFFDMQQLDKLKKN